MVIDARLAGRARLIWRQEGPIPRHTLAASRRKPWPGEVCAWSRPAVTKSYGSSCHESTSLPTDARSRKEGLCRHEVLDRQDILVPAAKFGLAGMNGRRAGVSDDLVGAELLASQGRDHI